MRALTAVSIVGIARAEHRASLGRGGQTDPWLALLASGVALAILVRRRTAATVRAARIVAVAVLLAGGIGVVLHINENYAAGPLDQRYSAVWETMSEPARWWTAFTKGVGPAPTFAPAALAEVAMLVARGGALPPR